jgi:hypothetical protein
MLLLLGGSRAFISICWLDCPPTPAKRAILEPAPFGMGTPQLYGPLINTDEFLALHFDRRTQQTTRMIIKSNPIAAAGIIMYSQLMS